MIFRLTSVSGDRIDVTVASIGELTLVRRSDGCFAEVGDEQADALVRVLAYAGIQADATQTDLRHGSTAIPATAGDLRPAPVDLVISDSVRIRRIPLGDATAEVLRRRFALFRAPSVDARRKAIRLLRGQDVMFSWQRRALVGPAAVRSLRRSSSLRPVILDRLSVGWTGAEPRAFASDGLLGRWAFG